MSILLPPPLPQERQCLRPFSSRPFPFRLCCGGCCFCFFRREGLLFFLASGLQPAAAAMPLFPSISSPLVQQADILLQPLLGRDSGEPLPADLAAVSCDLLFSGVHAAIFRLNGDNSASEHGPQLHFMANVWPEPCSPARSSASFAILVPLPLLRPWRTALSVWWGPAPARN